MSSALLARSLRASAAVLIALAAVIALYAVEVVYLYDPAVSESLALMQQALPELFEAFGMANPASTLLDFLINYLYGFLLTAALVLLAAYLAQRLVAGPAKDGSLAWLLAAPRRRAAIAGTLALAAALAVALLVAVTAAVEAAACEALFPGELDHASLARANAGLLALGLFAAALCLASACAFQRPGLGLGVGAGACALFFVMGLSGTVGEGLAWVADLSPFALFDPYGLAAGQGDAVAGAVALAVAAAALFAAAIACFCRRDFSL